MLFQGQRSKSPDFERRMAGSEKGVGEALLWSQGSIASLFKPFPHRVSPKTTSAAKSRVNCRISEGDCRDIRFQRSPLLLTERTVREHPDLRTGGASRSTTVRQRQPGEPP